MTDSRFDLEQKIMDCWGVCEDIETITVKLEDLDIPAEELDTLSNVLIGIKSLYHMKFEQLFYTFEKLVEDKEI